MALGDNCRTACKTRDHESWGACAKADTPMLAGCGIGGSDTTRQKAHDARLNSYFSAVSQGIQPAGTRQSQIDAAVRQAEKTGTPAAAIAKKA